MKKVLLLISLFFLPIFASAYVGENYRSFSGLEEMKEVTVNEIDHSASVFVSPDGDDENDGTIDSPLKTINAAVKKAVCYNTIYLREGTYNEPVVIDKSNLTLRNYPGEEAIITGIDLDGTTANVIVNQNIINIKIYGLKFQDRQEKDIEAAYGIIVYGGCKDIIIQNNEFKNINGNNSHYWDLYGYNAGAIALYGDGEYPIQNALITGNKIHDMDCGKSEAIIINGYVNKVDVIENEINDIFNIGIDVAGHYGANSDPNKDYARYVYVAGNKISNAVSTIADNGGIYVDGAKGVLVERNYITGCPFGISVGQENNITDSNLHVEDVVVSYNYIESSIKGGIRVGTNKLLGSSVFNSVVINNTIIQDPTAGSGSLVIGKSHDNEFVNNVVYDKGSWHNIVLTDDNSTEEEIYNTIIQHNYLYSTNHMWYEGGRYFKIAGAHMTEAEFDAVENYKDNIIGQQYALTDKNVIVAGTPLEIKGTNHEYKSILRDYEGKLGTDVIGMGYININSREETDETQAELKSVFPFKKNYLVAMPSDRKFCDCDNKVASINETEEVPEVKGEEETNHNPKTNDNILKYILLFMVGTLSLVVIKRQYNN